MPTNEPPSSVRPVCSCLGDSFVYTLRCFRLSLSARPFPAYQSRDTSRIFFCVPRVAAIRSCGGCVIFSEERLLDGSDRRKWFRDFRNEQGASSLQVGGESAMPAIEHRCKILGVQLSRSPLVYRVLYLLTLYLNQVIRC